MARSINSLCKYWKLLVIGGFCCCWHWVKIATLLNRGKRFQKITELSSCRPLSPTEGAIIYHPYTWAPGKLPPKATSTTLQDLVAYWRIEICQDDSSFRSQLDIFSKKILRANIFARQLLDFPEKSPNDFSLPALGPRKQYCDGCEGVFRLTRILDCSFQSPPLHTINPDDSLFSFAHALGPDELWVSLEGAEFHVLPSIHTGGCTYLLPFAVSIPGIYRLHALALRSDYASIDERRFSNGFPALTLDSITGSKLLLQLGSSSSEVQNIARNSILQSTLSPCYNVSDGNEGRYVRKIPTTSATFDPLVAPFKMPLNLGEEPMSFFVGLQDEFVFLPYACRRPEFNSTQTAARCFSSKKINFRGDSQMRVFFNHALKRVCGIPEAAIKGAWQESTCVRESLNCHDALICLTADPMALTLENSTEFDIVAVNFGQHPASQHRMPVAEYRLKVDKYFNDFEDLERDKNMYPELVIWLNTQTLCVSNRDYLHSFGDWRTPQRISLYNYATEYVLLNTSGRRVDAIVDFRNTQYPLSQLCHDSGHLIGVNNALDAMLWTVLDATCPEWGAP